MAKKVKKPKCTKPVEQKETQYQITVRIGNDVYEGSGETMLEALQTMPKPLKIFQKGIVTLQRGEFKREMTYMPMKLKRMYYPNTQIITAKNLAYLVK